ncbi:MAG: hypothetical protein ABI670_15185 [Chloroflexota bacterium]
MTAQLDTMQEEQTAVLPNNGGSMARRDLARLAAGTLVVTVVTFLFGLWGSGGHLAPSLDDTFIHLQYARQLAAGHPFQYNTGDLPSSGDSAFIYPFLLAPAFMIGLRGMAALIYADVLGLIAHLAAVLLFYNVGYRLGGRPLALLGAVFLLLDGSLNWTFLTGMETGLYTAALVAFFWAWLRGVPQGQFILLAAVGTLAALVRTEGHILISLACVATIAWLWRQKDFRPGYLWLVLPLLAGLIPYIVNQVTTGNWQFNTAVAKSIWYLPYSPLFEKISLTVGYGITAAKDLYMGLEIGRSPFPLLALPVAVLGAAAALRSEVYRTVHILMLTVLVGGIGLALLLPPLHFNRYFQPYDPLFWLYFTIGLLVLIKLATGAPAIFYASAKRSSHTHACAAAGIGLLILPQFVGYFFAFANSTRDVYYQQMTFSDWVRKYTPKETRLAVNDTGAHAYLSDRYTMDLIGLTDNRLRGAYFGGWGSIYDRLAAMPEAERPTHMLIHPTVFAAGIDESVSQSFIQLLYSIRIQNPTISAGDTEVLYKINWEYALLNPTLPYLMHTADDPLDSLNVGDTGDEARHDYKIEGRQPSISEQKSILTTSSYDENGVSLTESGRRHSGWEQFTLKSEPGKPLVLVSRSILNPDADQRLLVMANGREVGLWEVHNSRAHNWQEYEYVIPANFITSDHTTIRIDATFDPGGPGFASYRYWSYTP